ncbi:MAG: recombinase family protein, partial [Candidatus Omnitrophica bacterium]|nr:recombinase family protein [Candidatus Omnitrophota bacterium]
IGGRSLNKIVRSLNQDKIPTKRRLSGGWNLSSVSKILKNERYIGQWTWKKRKNVRDPLTGRKKRVLRPENEWLSTYRKDLIIIDKKEWEKTKKRWNEIKGAWPVRKSKQKRGLKQQSYVHSSPSHLLSGLMRCQRCNGAILLVSGKGGGYYGCFNAKRKTCTNTLLVPRKRIEKIIISELKEKLLTVENLRYVYEKVEKLASSGMNEIPEKIKNKKNQCEKIAREIQNYLNYIKMGNFSTAVSDALKDAEQRNKNLQDEVSSLQFQKQNTFKAPPKEWINERLDKLYQTLNQNTRSSALALKGLLGVIQLEPVSDKNEDFYGIEPGAFKPYYMAHTKIKTLALLDDRYKGSNWSGWWRWRESNPRP